MNYILSEDKIMKYYQYIFITFILIISAPPLLSAETKLPDFNESLSITGSELHHSEFKGYNYISCIGKLKNSSNTPWEELVLEVQFFNSNNELVDTFTEYIYGTVVPAKDYAAFRIRDVADKNIKEYQNHKVRVTSARPVIKYKRTKSKSKTFTKIFISWFPMLLLIAVWIFFIRKYQGKNSPQKKIIELQEKQYLLIEDQNLLFEKLIKAIKDK